MLLGATALLTANVWSLANPCAAVHPLLLWTMWLQWTCWNTLCMLWCAAAQAARLVDDTQHTAKSSNMRQGGAVDGCHCKNHVSFCAACLYHTNVCVTAFVCDCIRV